MAQYTPEYIQAFQNLVTKTKTFASVATQQSAPTTQDQKATGKSKGCSWALSQSVNQGSTGQTNGVQKATVNNDTPIVRGVLTMMIRGAVIEMPIITTQQDKGVAYYQVTQGAQMKAATYREDLCQKLYFALGIKVKELKVPIQIKAIRTHKEPYVSKKSPSMDIGHKKVPPQKDLKKSLICFHCQKKGHYARNCRTRRCAIKSVSTQSTAPVTLVNRFSVLEEETCLSTTVIPALVPKLLDAKEIRKRTFHADKIREIMTKIQKLPVKEQKKLKELLAPKPKFMVAQSRATIKVANIGQANDAARINATNIVATLKDKTVDEETRIAILEQVMPTSFSDGATLATILDTLKLKSVYFSMKNFVQVKFPLMHYQGQADEEALLNSGATENFIDYETIKRLKLGTTKLEYQRPVYNVDGTPNKHGTITHACDLLVRQGNKRERLRFYVSNLGKDRFIFGYPWFRKFNPDVDWENAKLRGPQVRVEMIQHDAKLRADAWLKYRKEKNEHDDLVMNIDTCNMQEQDASWTGEHCPSRGIRPGEAEETEIPDVSWREIMQIKATTAIEMAYKYATENATTEVTLPDKFKHHAALFSDKEAKKFPPACGEGDHKIELTANAPEKFNCKLYPMSLKDQATEDKFIDENLEKGYIVPSSSPYGFSTFMVAKKDSNEKRYIIDYRPLNAVTRKDVTPLPNLAQCIEDLQGMEVFSKFDIC